MNIVNRAGLGMMIFALYFLQFDAESDKVGLLVVSAFVFIAVGFIMLMYTRIYGEEENSP